MATIRISGKEEKIILAGTEELVASDGAADKNITTKTMLSDRLLSKDVAGNSTVTLTATEALYGQIVFTGALTGNISVTVPDATAKAFTVYNNTSGAYTLTFKTVTGTGVVLPQGLRNHVQADGTNMVFCGVSTSENRFTGTQKWSKGVDVASANALTLGADGNYFDITGTTSITSITTVAVGTVVKLHFDGILILTHHATDLILPSGANVTTAAGDEAEFVEYATGDWRCTCYTKANGHAIAEVAGITTVATATTSTTLTAGSAGYQYIAMTTIGQSITLPDATTMAVGSPKYYLDNSSGGYPVGIRNNSGTLLMAIAAGGTAYVSCESIGTAAGVWSITGTNLEPGLITIDNTFSSTYAATVLKPYAALDDDNSIHFLALASGFAAVAVDKTTGAVGTPVTVSATASAVPKQCFKITATTAIVFYGADSNTLYGVVISLSGATTLAVGTPANSGANTGIAVEDFSAAPKIAQLDTTHYLVSWATATGAGNTSVMACEVTSGTTVTFGAKADIITSNNVINSTTTYALTATTGLVLYKSGAGAPYANNGVVISVSGTTCTPGTPAALTNVGSSLTAVTSSCLLSATKCLVQDDNNTAGSVIASVFTISGGTTVTAGTPVSVETGITTSSSYTANSATRYNPHLFPLSASTARLWYFDSSSVSRAVVLSESGGTVTAGTILYRSISAAAGNAVAGGAMLPQGTTEFVALRSQSAQIGNLGLYPSKISGTTITTGAGIAARELPPNRPDQVTFSRLSSGDYVYTQSSVAQFVTTGPAPQELLVFRSNGDFINRRGTIKAPPMIGNYEMAPSGVSSNRLVIVGATTDGTTVGASTLQLRLLSVEIAA